MNRGRYRIRSIMEQNDINTELLPGVPLIEICDRKRVLIENHQGIIGYGPNEVKVKSRCGCIQVCGEQLKLMRMSKVKLVITGFISAVNLYGGQ